MTFVLIGQQADPAGVKGKDIQTALEKAVQAKAAPFVSRGDKSGTHSAELALWSRRYRYRRRQRVLYREIGRAWRGAQLPAGGAMNAMYCRTAHLDLIQEPGDLEIVVEGDKRLFNQ